MNRRLVNVLLTGAVLVAIIALYRATPTQGDIQQPVEVKGQAGEVVRTPRFDLTVEGVRVGKSLKVPRTTPDRDTSTSFVVVDAFVTARREPIHLGTVKIRTAEGVEYLVANRTGLDRVDLTGHQLSPGIGVRGSLVFEMPADRLPGAELLVIENSIFTTMEPQATVALGVESDQLAGLEQPVVEVTPASAT